MGSRAAAQGRYPPIAAEPAGRTGSVESSATDGAEAASGVVEAAIGAAGAMGVTTGGATGCTGGVVTGAAEDCAAAAGGWER